MTSYDIIGDVHGCADELQELMDTLGYDSEMKHPEGRLPILLGDLVDRGPKIVETLDIARKFHCVIRGNHDQVLLDYIRENPDQSKWDAEIRPHWCRESVRDLKHLPRERVLAFADFIEFMPHFIRIFPNPHLDMTLVHASYQPHILSLPFRRFKFENACLWGDQDGWSMAQDWHSLLSAAPAGIQRIIIHGHRNTRGPRCYINSAGVRIYGIDTGCVYGNCLTAIRIPEFDFVSVSAKREYWRISSARWWS